MRADPALIRRMFIRDIAVNIGIENGLVRLLVCVIYMAAVVSVLINAPCTIYRGVGFGNFAFLGRRGDILPPAPCVIGTHFVCCLAGGKEFGCYAAGIRGIHAVSENSAARRENRFVIVTIFHGVRLGFVNA